MEIHVFSDVVCPWCYIGTHRLDRVLAAEGLTAKVNYHPFFLDPSVPPEGKNIAVDLRSKYGVDARKVQERAEAAARASDLALDLTRQSMSYPTARAQTLIRHAAGRGTQQALVRALFEAYFQDALDISDPGVLQKIATPHGFTADDVAAIVNDENELRSTRAAVEEAYQLGIQGVPFFIFNEKLGLSGAQPESVFREALQKAA